MFNDEAVRQQAIILAASQNEGAMRQVLDDFNERIAAMEGGAAPPAAPPAPAEVPLDERIKIAIRALPESGFGANGKPNVKAIEQALGENITAADRDRVWEAIIEEDEA